MPLRLTSPDERISRPLLLAITLLFVAYAVTQIADGHTHSDLLQSADRALSYVRGHGWRVWASPYVSASVEPVVSNSPLNAGVLALWLSIFGDSLPAVKAFHHVLALGCGVVLLIAARGFHLVRWSSTGAALFAVVLFATPLRMSYGYGRYDMIGILVVAVCFLSTSKIRRRPLRLAALLACGVLLAGSGVQFAALGLAMGVLVTAATGRRWWPEVAAVGVGGALGFAILLASYASLGLLEGFTEGVLGFEQVSSAKKDGRSLAKLGKAITNNGTNLLLMGLLTVVAVRRGGVIRRVAIVGVAAGVAIPVYMSLIGNYTRWYAWMPFLPLVAAGAHVLDALDLKRSHRLALTAAVALLLIGPTAPRHFALGLLEWDVNRSSLGADFLAANLRPSDVVVADAYSFVDAGRYAKAVHSLKGLPTIDPEGRAGVNVVVWSYAGGVSDFELEPVLAELGGRWTSSAKLEVERGALIRRLGGAKEKHSFSFEIFRRVE